MNRYDIGVSVRPSNIQKLRQNLVKAITRASLFVSVFAFSITSFALTSGISYHGRITQSDGVTPVSGSVQFKMQVRTPDASNCLMYEEWQTINMTGTNGVFTIVLNDGSGTRHDSSGYTFDQAFANRGTFSFASGACTGGTTTYTPSIADGRNFKVSFQSSSMTVAEDMPAQSLSFAPLAIESKQISGFQATNLLRFAKSDGTLVNTSPLDDTQYAELVALVNGSSSVYAKAGSASGGTSVYATAGSVSSPAVGSMWLDTTGGTDQLKINTDSGVQTIGLNSGGSFVNSVTAGTGLSATTTSGATTVSVAAGGITATELATGAVTSAKILDGTIIGADLSPSLSITTTGTLSAAGASVNSLAIWNAQSTPNSVSLVAPSAAFTNYSLTLPTSVGTSGQVLSSDGTGVLSWITPATTGVSAVTAAATAGNPVVILGTSAPTIDIGKADLTHNGYLSAADYSTFSNKAAGSLASGTIFVGNSSGVATGVAVSGDLTLTSAGAAKVVGLQGVGIGTTAPSASGQVIRYNGSVYQPSFLSMADIRSTTLPTATIFPTTSCAASKALSWSSLTDSFTCQDIAINTTQIAGLGTAAALNVGIGGSNVIQLDASTKLPAVDGSQLTGLNAGSIMSGTLPVSRGGTGATSFANYSAIASNSSGNQVAVPGSTSGTMLQWTVTGPAWTSAVYPSSTTTNSLLYSSATNVVSQIPPANNGVLVTNVSGVPSIGSTLPSAVQTNITQLGTVTSGAWNGTAIAAANGGTGQTSYTIGDLLYANSSSTLTRLPASTSGYVLKSNGAGSAPSWQAPSAGTPAGSSNQLQFNSGGSFGASADLTFDGAILAMNGTSSFNYVKLARGAFATGISAESGSSGDISGKLFLGTNYYGGAWISSVANNSWSPTYAAPSDLVFGSSSTNASPAPERMRITGTGKVGIGTTAPVVALDVAGAVKSQAVSNASGTIDFLTGNYQYTTSSCGTFTLNNLKSGAAYTLAVQGGAGGTCSFNAYSDSGSTALTVKLGSVGLVQTAGRHALFTFIVMGSYVYVASIDGY